MKLPRDISGAELVRALRRIGYETVRQSGSHIRLATTRGGEHHVTVPNHNAIKIGTLSGILGDVAAHLQISREDLARQLFA
jgi:predicted RNA binding protein YcfA (HicA-like mRNA interferase family)